MREPQFAHSEVWVTMLGFLEVQLVFNGPTFYHCFLNKFVDFVVGVTEGISFWNCAFIDAEYNALFLLDTFVIRYITLEL